MLDKTGTTKLKARSVSASSIGDLDFAAVSNENRKIGGAGHPKTRQVLLFCAFTFQAIQVLVPQRLEVSQ